MTKHQSVNACWINGPRPMCPCCGGGEYRPGYTMTKAGSHDTNIRESRAKPKGKKPNRGGVRILKGV